MALCCLPVFITHAGRRHDDDAEAAVHPGGDGPCVDGEESVQRETDGAAGGCTVDRNDQVNKNIFFFQKPHFYLNCYFSVYVFFLYFVCDVIVQKIRWWLNS